MERKKFYQFLFLYAIFSILFAACAPAAVLKEIEEQEAIESVEDAEPMVFFDDMENKLEFMDHPQAILSLSPSTTELLFAVGAADQVIGRDDMSTFPTEAIDVTSVGAMWGDLPTESILALEPDLVLVAQIISAEQVTALQDLGLQVYWQANPTTFEDLYENIREIAALTGNQDDAEPIITALDARVKAVQEVAANAEETPSVFYELDATDPSNPWTSGSGTFIDYIITMAGGSNAASVLAGDYAQFSAEELITVNPDVILLGDALYGVSPENVVERAGWDVIAAVQDGAVYPIDPNLLSIPGPRLVDGLEEMAKLLHPELFE